MRHDESIGRVRQRVTRATLHTLAERIPDSVVASLAGPLPDEIAEHPRRVEQARVTDSGERCGVGNPSRAWRNAAVRHPPRRRSASTPGLRDKVGNTSRRRRHPG